MNKTYFISDLHLGDETREINSAFFQFIERLATQANNVDALYVLGDFFEMWIGDDNQTELSDRVAECLSNLSSLGIKIYFIHGNRDFLIKKHYAKKCGMHILAAQTVIDLYGQPTLLCHGDEMCTDDIEYQKFRKKSRTWWWQTLMLTLPLSFRQKKAATIRAKSKESKKSKSLDIMDVNEHTVSEYFDRFGVNQMIHGHTHRPHVHQYKSGKTRYVLGDWYSELWYIEATQNDLKLLQEPL